MKRIALVLALTATFASAAQKVRLYGEAREVTTVPVLNNMPGTGAETNIGFTGAVGVQTPVNRQVLFDAHTGFFAARWGKSDEFSTTSVTSYFQSIGAGFQFQPTKVFGLSLGFAYDIALDNSVSYESNIAGASATSSSNTKSLKDKNVALAEFGAAVKVSRHLDVVGNYRLPITPYWEPTTSSSVKLHQLNIGLRYTFNAKSQIDAVE